MIDHARRIIDQARRIVDYARGAIDRARRVIRHLRVGALMSKPPKRLDAREDKERPGVVFLVRR